MARIIADPNGVLVNGKRYPKGTPLGQIDGVTDAQIKAWERFNQLSDVPETAGEENETTAAAPPGTSAKEKGGKK